MIATTIEEVIEQLQKIVEVSKTEESPLGYFAALYLKVTITVKNKLHTNYFDNDTRMEQLDVVFANRYINAYKDYKKGKEITKSWYKAFELSKNKSLIVLQHLLLGMNAHINLDLGIAAAEITTPETIADLHNDFNKINEILSSLVNVIQKDLTEINPGLFWVLKLFKNVDDFLIDFSMDLARNGAWKFANELSTSNDKETLIIDRDLKISELTTMIVHQRLIVRIIFKLIRMGERGSVTTKIDALLN